MSETESNPREQVVIQVTDNTELHATRFCLETCGLYGEAQEMALLETVMTTGEPATLGFEEVGTGIQSEAEIPNIKMKCKGPRRRFLVMGDLVCRENAQINTLDK